MYLNKNKINHKDVAINKTHNFTQKLFYYLPILVILSGLILKIAIYRTSEIEYWADEIILVEISKQPIGQLMEIIKSEPHPPLFYFLLKLLPMENILRTRILITTISNSLLFFVLLWGYKSKIIRDYRLNYGLALFFSSYTFLELTTYIKQEAFSFPFLLMFFFVLAKAIKTKTHIQVKELVFMHVLLVIIFSLGYIYYLAGVSLLALYSIPFLKTKNKIPLVLLVLQILMLSAYLYVLGFEQFVINKSRFSYLSLFSQNFFWQLGVHLGAGGLKNYLGDLLITLFVTLTIFSFKLKKQVPRINSIFFPLIFFIALVVIISYLFKMLGTTRHSSLLFLLVSLLAGWGGTYILKNRSKTACLLVIAFFSISFSYFAKNNTGRFITTISEIINSESQDKTFGYVDDGPLLPLFLKLNNNIDAEPIYITQPDAFADTTSLKKEHLMLEGKRLQATDSEIINLFAKHNLQNYFYRLEFNNYFDPERKVLKILDNHCVKRKSIPLNRDNILFKYEDCNF